VQEENYIKTERYVFCKHLGKKLKIYPDAIPETRHGWGWICDCGNWTGLDPDEHIVVD